MSAVDICGSATDELAERLFVDTIDVLKLATMYLGDRLGYYGTMVNGQAVTAPVSAKVHLRYDAGTSGRKRRRRHPDRLTG